MKMEFFTLQFHMMGLGRKEVMLLTSVIDLVTGLPIDFEVLSNFCHKCKIAESSKDVSDEWKLKHAENCQKNFGGTSNGMEVECAKRIWGRSVEKFKLCYTTMLSDGDSKAYDAITQANVYGEKKITKEDCINHMSKRMGTGLSKLVDTGRAQGKSISGKGKLTREKIIKIQNYYGRAIKDNTNDIETMKRRIFAILFHMSSTDSAPKHTHCPLGSTSWCFWQRDIANDREPGKHGEHQTLPPDIGKLLVPLFQRLSHEDLLKRCARGKTQNANESFHNIIWRICPKVTFVGRKTIETAVALAACQYSMGATYKAILCQKLQIEPGSALQSMALQNSIKRIQKGEKANTAEAKKRRKCVWNFNGLKSSKLQKLKSMDFDSISPLLDHNDLICFSETWRDLNDDFQLDLDNNFSEFHETGRRNFCVGRPSGGMSLLIRKSIANYCSIVQSDSHHIWCQIDKDAYGWDSDLFIFFLYIPPNTSTWFKSEQSLTFDSLQHECALYEEKGVGSFVWGH